MEEVSENGDKDRPLEAARVRGPRGDEAGRGPREMRCGLVRSVIEALRMDDLDVDEERSVGDGGGFMLGAWIIMMMALVVNYQYSAHGLYIQCTRTMATRGMANN